jgi:hypothetical protein
MLKQTVFLGLFPLALAVSLASGTAVQAAPMLVNVDLKSSSGEDAYTTGSAVFGTPTSQWNTFPRGFDQTNAPLFDDSGASTSVQVTYTRLGSGSVFPSGAYADLASSYISSGPVTIAGLSPGGNYNLAIYGSNSVTTTLSWSVDSVIKSLTTSLDWSSLNEGTQYVLFSTSANSSGVIEFTPQSSDWSAFQLQGTSTPPPAAPGPLPILGVAAAFRSVRKLRRLYSARKSL